MQSTDTIRNATLQDMVAMLRNQQARKVDVVVPAKALWSRDGNVLLHGVEPLLEDDGITDPNGSYRPTAVWDEGIAAKLNVPLAYVRRMRGDGMASLMDANVNGLLHGHRAADGTEVRAAEARSFMVRLFQGADGTPGVARALLSPSYKRIENLDVLMAVLEGINATGTEVEIQGADLTDRRMYVRISAPGIQALAPELLKNYRSPFSGNRGADNPTVFAGFVLSNSETGGGAFTITPRLTVQVCTNGMTITKDALRAVHLGGRQDDGVIDWKADTQKAQLDLIKLRARDAVTTFLNREYMEGVIRAATEAAGKPVENAVETLKVVSKKLSYSQSVQDGILDHFIKGADATAGGVMHAVTSYAQLVEDADEAAALEATALQAMALV